MKRILLVLTVALVMVAMLIVTASPAFAPPWTNKGGNNPPGQTPNPNPGK